MPMRAGECPAVKSGSAIWGKSKTPARGFLRANCFDDQGMSQGGAGLSTANIARLEPLKWGGFRWLDSRQSGFPGFCWVDS
jgi:hypothetical protein